MNNQASSVKAIVLFSTIIIALFVQVVQWDKYYLSIIPLQFKNLIGVANTDDVREIIKICTERLKHGCVERNLSTLSLMEKDNADILYELGEIRRKTGDLSGAFNAYVLHFQRGGNSNNAAYELARLFDKKGDSKNAHAYYEKALLAKPELLQVTVIQAYVQSLVNSGRLKEAKSVIEDARKKRGATADYFMAKELDLIKTQLKASI